MIEEKQVKEYRNVRISREHHKKVEGIRNETSSQIGSVVEKAIDYYYQSFKEDPTIFMLRKGGDGGKN